jgi:hypothetical protein
MTTDTTYYNGDGPPPPQETPPEGILIPSNADAFRRRREEGQVYRLPGTGLNARLRSTVLSALVTRGGAVPNRLADEVARLLMEGRPSESRTIDPARQMESYKKYFNGVIQVARLVFVEPRIAEDWHCSECDHRWSGPAPDRKGLQCPRCQKLGVETNEARYDYGEVALADLHDLDLFFAWRVTQEDTDSLAPFRVARQPGETG